MSALIGLMFSVALVMLVAGVRRVRVPGYETHTAPYATPQLSSGPRTRYQRFVRPSALKLADHVGILRGMTDSEKIATQLDYAGNPGGITAHEFYGIQMFSLIACAIAGGLWMGLGLPFGPPVLVLMPVFGFVYPQLWLRGKVRRRQRAITIALPDLLDMMAICVSAGMGFDITLRLLTDRGEGPLYEEMDRLLRELAIGEPRESAFRHVIKRNSSEDLRTFMDALLQADDLGTPIAATLERQAEDMRVNRNHHAREEGAKATNKLALVLTFLIMPSVVCILIGGLLLSITQNGEANFILPE
ncbi:MAG: type II secretion system F family protein [Roseiflexaceae bacterium]|nr:type II secretion system F family protein [Roseiflexaceae bacterium]